MMYTDGRHFGMITRAAGLLVGACLLLAAAPASAVKVSDITHLQGSRVNKLNGFGLVMGLKSTGDGGKYYPTMRSLARLYQNYGLSAISIDEFKNAKNIAVVEVEAVLPADGVREGDRVDVTVISAGAAKSLAGGQLFMCPLVGPNPQDNRIWALASGPLQVVDPENPVVARIAKGAVLERDFVHNYVVLGRDLAIYKLRSPSRPLEWIQPDERYVTFVLDESHAEWSVANTIAQYINEDSAVDEGQDRRSGARLAVAFDPRTVVVRVPRSEWENPAAFLGRIENLQLLMPATEARVTINKAAGIIAVKGDVEISPVIITHKGLTIVTTAPTPAPAQNGQRVSEGPFAVVDPQRRGGASLMDLLDALNQLRVPAADRIAIVENLHRMGQLHATLLVDQ